ncbi:class I SAM-dependent methyltransferase [soil metagenome]
MSNGGLAPDLSGVPETLLWPLHARASEARRPDSPFQDPKAIKLVESINYPFDAKFGYPQQVLALRELSFDGVVEDFLRRHPAGTVVALADGLNTQYWRIDNGQSTWLSVDLPDVIDIRRRLLPDPDRLRSVACSALDEQWMDLVDADKPLLITAQGLFMYLHEADVYGLIRRCAARFRGASILFDCMPRHFTVSVRGNTLLNTFFMPGKQKGAGAYKFPPMPWSSSFESARARLLAEPDITGVDFVRMQSGRGLIYGYGSPVLASIPYLRSLIPWYSLVQFR